MAMAASHPLLVEVVMTYEPPLVGVSTSHHLSVGVVVSYSIVNERGSRMSVGMVVTHPFINGGGSEPSLVNRSGCEP
jgi:hypothetical protein